MNKDQIEGRAKEAEVKAQEVAGKIDGSGSQVANANARKRLG